MTPVLIPEKHRILINFIKKHAGRTPYQLDPIAWIKTGIDSNFPMFRTSTRDNDGELFCSELVASLYQNLGLFRRSHPAAEYTPQDFRRDILHFTSQQIGFAPEFIDIKCPDFDVFNVTAPPKTSFPGNFKVKLPDGRIVDVPVPRGVQVGQSIRVIVKKPEPRKSRICICENCTTMLEVGPYLELFRCGKCGSINYTKLCKMVGSPETMGKDSGEKSRRQVALNLFKQYDEDNSGSIERAELRHMLLMLNFPANLIDSEFDKADVDKSGTLDFEEFFSYYTAFQARSKEDIIKASEVMKSKEALATIENQYKDILARSKSAEEALDATSDWGKRRKIELHNRALEVQDELMKLSHQLHGDHIYREKKESEKNNDAKRRLELRKKKRQKSSKKLGRKVSAIVRDEEISPNSEVVEINDKPSWVVHDSPDGKCFLYNTSTGEMKPFKDFDEESESEDEDESEMSDNDDDGSSVII